MVLRFWELGNLPGGMWFDEGLMGQGIIRILYGNEWPIYFFNNGFPEEPVSYYLSAFSVAIFGHELWAYRLPNAMIGTLTIPATWWFVRQFFSPRVAIISMIVLATMRWHIHFSRLGFRTLVGPFMAVLVMGALSEMLRRRNLRWAAIAGILLGLSLYTYIAMRLFAFAVTLMLVIGTIRVWLHYKKHSHMERKYRPPSAPNSDCVFWMMRALLTVFGFTLLAFSPLLTYFIINPDHATARQDQITLRTEEGINWSLLASNTRDVALMGIVRGDDEIKHNLPGYPEQFSQSYLFPTGSADDSRGWETIIREAQIQIDLAYTDGSGHSVFDIITGILFYLGIGICLWRSIRGDWCSQFLVAWLLFGAAASVLSVGAPNMLRTLLLTPAAATFISIGIYGTVFEATRARGSSKKEIPQRGLVVLGSTVVFLLWFSAGETYRYFGEWKNHPSVYGAFNQDFTDVAKWARDDKDADLIVLPPFLADFTSVQFLIYDDPRIVSLRYGELKSSDGTIYKTEDLSNLEIVAIEPLRGYPPLELPDGYQVRDSAELHAFDHPQLVEWAWVYPVKQIPD